MLCTRCLDPLPDDRHPHARTCADWCHAEARRYGDCLDDATEQDLTVLRALCGLTEALREGRERIEV